MLLDPEVRAVLLAQGMPEQLLDDVEAGVGLLEPLPYPPRLTAFGENALRNAGVPEDLIRMVAEDIIDGRHGRTEPLYLKEERRAREKLEKEREPVRLRQQRHRLMRPSTPPAAVEAEMLPREVSPAEAARKREATRERVRAFREKRRESRR